MLSIIVAIAQNNTIGIKNQMPWHIPEDFQHFKKTTMGHTIAMGENTFRSLGRPLPGRKNVVLTDKQDYQAPGCTIIHSLEDLIALGKSDEEIFIIGGAMVYKQMLPHVDKLYLTYVKKDFEGDTFFPTIDFENDFEIIEKSQVAVSEKQNLPYQFVTAMRKQS